MNYDKEYYESPEFRELMKRYEEAVEQHSIPYFGINELADLLAYGLATGKLELAANVLAIAKNLHPNTPDCIKMEVKCLIANGEPRMALKLFDKIDNPDIELSLLKAEVYTMLKENIKAEEIALGLLSEMNPEDEPVYYALEVLLDCGLAMDVLKYCENVLKVSPNIKTILEVKAESLIELQEIEKAVEIYNNLLDDAPYNTTYWEQLGHIYYMTEKYGKALECFEYETDINPEITYARIMQGFCYFRMRDYRHAWEIFEEFSTGEKKDMTSLFYRGVTLHKEGKNEEALEAFALASSYVQEGSIEKMLIRINKAMLLDMTGNCKSAEDALSMALMMRPKEARQLIFQDAHLYELKCKECMTFEEMGKSDSAGWNEAEEIYQLGVHLAKYNHLALAKRVFIYARGMFNDPTDVYAYIAYTAWHTGYKEQARNAAGNALEGKSFLIFDLFGLPYNANISTDEFMSQIMSKG